MHGLDLIHCDLKPENILIVVLALQIKVIDFGSSCFTRDHLSSYVQSRSYRAPEVLPRLPIDLTRTRTRTVTLTRTRPER